MGSHRRAIVASALFAATCLCASLPAAAQQPPAAQQPAPQRPEPPVSAADMAFAKPFLDKAGGYRDRAGGYYDLKAGTYTDDEGGKIDNWGGYLFTDGSYKTRFGDYFDKPKREFELTSGKHMAPPDGMAYPEVLALMRKQVELNGGFDKDFVRRLMINQIRQDHPKGNAGR